METIERNKRLAGICRSTFIGLTILVTAALATVLSTLEPALAQQGPASSYLGTDLLTQAEADSTTQERTDDDDDEDHPMYPSWDRDSAPAPVPTNWSSFLPLWGQAVRKMGYDLPLPLGFSVHYVHIDRDIDVDRIDFRIGSGPKQSIDQFLQLDSNSSVDVTFGRFDVWILPFLNIYGYAGWQWNDSSVRIDVTVPSLDPQPPLQFIVEDDGEIDGPVYGTGVLLAMGYESLFLVNNVDFSWADFDEFDSRFEGRVYGFRVGWDGAIPSGPMRIWTGGMYFDTDTTIEGRVNVTNLGEVRFEVEQGPRHPWNSLIGVNLGFRERWEVNFEYGFNFDDVHIFNGIATIRF